MSVYATSRYIGTPASRVDGPAKVTGAAKYAAEAQSRGLAYASAVTSPITKGRIIDIDVRDAMRVEGVIDVLTHAKRPAMASSDKAYGDDTAPDGTPFRPLYDDEIRFNGQPVALVIAEEPEIARFAATLVRVRYEPEKFDTEFGGNSNGTGAGDGAGRYVVPPGSNPFAPPNPRGDADKAFAAAAVRHDAEYRTPIEHHNPMELFATTVIWDGGGKLTVWDKTQGVQNVQKYLCNVFQMRPGDIKVLSPYMGGGFGSGLRPQYQAVLAVLAAKAIERSVRLVLTRQQMYEVGYRPGSIQHLKIGAAAGGILDAIVHEASTVTSRYENFYRQETGWSGLQYTSKTARYAHTLDKLDLPTACDMRAPSAATGVYALECAMDELAVALKMDPLELRLKCYSDRDQNAGRPYSSKALRECYRQGAEAFGWGKRNAEPRSMRDGHDLVGWGMASGIWEALQMPIAVRIALTANGHAEVSCATSDIGTGTYTIMAQVTAEMLGLPLESITVKLGDSTLPSSPVEGGSWIAASVANGIVTTCTAVRNELVALAQKMPGSPLSGVKPEECELVGGSIVRARDASQSVPLADVMRHAGRDRIEREEQTKFSEDKSLAHNTHSAVFVDVRVDEQLGVIRVERVVNAVAAGRILNTKTARSQILGGVVWGIGMALHEETLSDQRFGRVMNANIAEYHIPVNADIHDIDVIFVDEPDKTINPLGIKGLGEIGIVGVAAAVANAVYHATGKRVRDLPITLDKLLAH
jgi:xanthine dehydrogenase YagR molybdenum-binding subunit